MKNAGGVELGLEGYYVSVISVEWEQSSHRGDYIGDLGASRDCEHCKHCTVHNA